MMRAVGSIFMCLLVSHGIVDAVGTYYKEISCNDGNTHIEGSMQRTPIIHKSFHKCSTSEHCKYVIKNLTNGIFSLLNGTADLPRNRTRLRIWMKNYRGPFHDCQEAYNKGYKTTTTVPINIPGMDSINVRCDMVTDGGGWIVFQRRINTSVDFNLGWDDCKNGFGDLNGNFWLGLENIHKLASPGKGAKLCVDLKHFRAPSMIRHAEYTKFEILSESEGYKLQIDGYSGDAGDSFSYHNDCYFSTKDRDQDSSSGNCAKTRKGGWWYNACLKSCLNALYPINDEELATYIGWNSLHKSLDGGVIFSEMKIKYSSQ